MEIEIAIAILILFALVFLATIDIAFTQLSDFSLRRLSTETEENKHLFLQEILENRPRFRFALSATIQILLIIFSVLVTLILIQVASSRAQIIIFSFLSALVLAYFFRQFIPRFLARKNPEAK